MPAPRPTPFSLWFGDLAPGRFPLLREGLAAAGYPPEDRDGFLLVREVAELLRELRPEEDGGAALHALVALLHSAYLFWMHGEQLRVVSETELAALVATPPGVPTSRPLECPTRYVQLPALRVWSTPVAEQPAEPLDGWFVTRKGGHLQLLAVFGLSPARAGLTLVDLSGPRPRVEQRRDGTPPFRSLLTGGAAAGLISLADEDELLELAWRQADA